MPRSRVDLHNELVSVFGSRYVYYQPPESVKLHYPCVIYSKDRVDQRRANDSIYSLTNVYNVTIVGKDPDSDTAERLLRNFMHCRFDRRYVADGLYHDVLTLHY